MERKTSSNMVQKYNSPVSIAFIILYRFDPLIDGDLLGMINPFSISELYRVIRELNNLRTEDDLDMTAEIWKYDQRCGNMNQMFALRLTQAKWMKLDPTSCLASDPKRIAKGA